MRNLGASLFLSGNQSKTLPENRKKIFSAINLKHIPREHMIFSDYYNVKNPPKWGNYPNF